MALLGVRAIGIFDRAVMHVPVETAHAACAMATCSGDPYHLCRLGDDGDLRAHRCGAEAHRH